MAETKWCPSCGDEYIARVSTCAECGVPLVGQEPTPPAAPTYTPREPSEDVVEYDLTDWDDDTRGSLEWMLRGRNVTFEWERAGVLIVGESDEQVVDDFVNYLSAGPPDSVEPDAFDELTEFPRPADSDLDIDLFYELDPRRRESEEVEYGTEWTDRDGVAYELCWIEDTGELFLMTADRGVNVQVLGIWPARADVDSLLSGWEREMRAPHSVEWVRDRVAPRSAPVQQTADVNEPASVDEWWAPPAAIGWIAPELDNLARAYFEWRAGLQPDAALEEAMKEVLDRSSRERLSEFFGGEMDVVYGAGTGERTRVALRDALERRMLPAS